MNYRITMLSMNAALLAAAIFIPVSAAAVQQAPTWPSAGATVAGVDLAGPVATGKGWPAADATVAPARLMAQAAPQEPAAPPAVAPAMEPAPAPAPVAQAAPPVPAPQPAQQAAPQPRILEIQKVKLENLQLKASMLTQQQQDLNRQFTSVIQEILQANPEFKYQPATANAPDQFVYVGKPKPVTRPTAKQVPAPPPAVKK